MRASARLACCALLGLAVAAGCGSKAPAVTGLLVKVTMVNVAADQLQLGVTAMDGTVIVMPSLRPESAGGALATPQSVSIFLSDDLAGTTVTCTVTAFSGGQATRAMVSGTATLVKSQLVTLPLDLAGANDDAGAQDAPSGDAAGGDVGAGEATDGGAGEVGTDGPGSKALGQPCTIGPECDSTLCVDGVCCASTCGTLCQACNLPGKAGTCSPVPSGMAPAATSAQKCAPQPASTCSFDGTCDGNGGCRLFPAGAQCQAASCNGASYMPASACDGQGMCVAGKAVDCTPYKCGTVAAVPACLTTCATGGTDCVSPAVCANNSCGARPKQANGAGCVADTDCTSAHCADGVCCGSACAGACTSCKLTGMEGMCLPVGVGKPDPHNLCKDAGAATCGRNGLCDGASGCALYAAATTCAAGSCKNATLHPARHCDGKGVCAVPADVDCTPYRCDTATTACFTSCTIAALQCTTRRCTANVCQ